jgi:anthranilate synthase/aminodeoxychorismate synthase-like glutamine amidotransferase
MPMILVVDNHDSFTFNLVQLLAELGAVVEVRRNHEIDLAGIDALAPEGVLLSPGPGAPEGAGVTLPLLRAFAGRVPIFGVCLGQQAIGQVFGGMVVRARAPMHGRVSLIHHAGRGVFAGIPSPFSAMRYHSLVVARAGLPSELEVTAWTDEGEIMGLRHRTLPVEGVQFHPESFLSEHGADLLRGFLRALPDGGRRA